MPGSVALDGGERPQRFAQRERGARPDFENGEVIAHQRGEVVRRLVVGRMRLEHELRIALDAGLQLARLVRLVVDHLVQVELDAGLDHQRDHARPGGFETRGRERLAMRFDGQRGGAR